MKIYFACPCSSLQDQQDRYLAILQCIRSNDYELSRDWVEPTLDLINQDKYYPNHADLCNPIRAAIDQADLVIFEVTHASMGVGQQMMYALEQHKPTLLLSDTTLSRSTREIFLFTNDQETIRHGNYTTIDEMLSEVHSFLDFFKKSSQRVTLHIDQRLYRELDRLASIEGTNYRNIIEKQIQAYQQRKMNTDIEYFQNRKLRKDH